MAMNGIHGVVEAKDRSPNHHARWDQALQQAVDAAAENLKPGDERDFSVSLSVRVVKTNPGWINRYTATLTPQ